MTASATSSLAFADVGEFDTTHLVTEDDTPVDNLLTALGEKLLTSALADSWKPPLDEETGEPRVFTALANVGVFTTLHEPAIVPDVAIVLDVLVHPDVKDRSKRSYFAWEQGKVPEIVIEVVSDKTGEELGKKRRQYRRMGIPYYIVWDPLDYLGKGELNIFAGAGGLYVSQKDPWFESLQLGLCLWEGTFEGCDGRWLRWCDRDGVVIPVGIEVARIERARADGAEERAQRLLARLREAGLEP